jgi:hypothetical protein
LSNANHRDDRRVENELMFAKLNEQYESSVKDHLNANDFQSHVLNYFCECSDIKCFEHVPVTIAEYHKIHERPELFVVKPGHEQTDIETVTDRTADYVVVAKVAIAS